MILLSTLYPPTIVLVATVAQRGGCFIAEAKQVPDAELWTATHASRESLPDRIAMWVHAGTEALVAADSGFSAVT